MAIFFSSGLKRRMASRDCEAAERIHGGLGGAVVVAVDPGLVELGALGELLLGNEVVTKYYYDAQGRLLHMRSADAGVSATLHGFSFRYDALGRRIFKEEPGRVYRFVHQAEEVLCAIAADTTPGSVELDFTYNLYTTDPTTRSALASIEPATLISESRFYHRNEQGTILDITRRGT